MTAPDSGRERAEALRLLASYTDAALTLNGLHTVATMDSTPDALLDDAINRATHETHFLRDVILRLLAQHPTPDPAEALRAENGRLLELLRKIILAYEIKEMRPMALNMVLNDARAALAQAGAVDSKEG